MGMGGPSPYDIREKLKAERDQSGLVHQMKTDVERLQSEAMDRPMPLRKRIGLRIHLVFLSPA